MFPAPCGEGEMKRLWKSAKLLWAVRAFTKRVEEIGKMDDKPMKKSMTVWGGLVAALVPISAAVLGMLGLQALVLPVAEILGGIAALLLIVGKRRVDGQKIANGKR